MLLEMCRNQLHHCLSLYSTKEDIANRVFCLQIIFTQDSLIVGPGPYAAQFLGGGTFIYFRHHFLDLG